MGCWVRDGQGVRLRAQRKCNRAWPATALRPRAHLGQPLPRPLVVGWLQRPGRILIIASRHYSFQFRLLCCRAVCLRRRLCLGLLRRLLINWHCSSTSGPVRDIAAMLGRLRGLRRVVRLRGAGPADEGREAWAVSGAGGGGGWTDAAAALIAL